MRTVLVGAVESTRAALETLVAEGAAPAAVFTLPRDRTQRHSDFADLRPVAEAHGIPVMEVANVNEEASLERLRSYEPELIFVIGWSQICRESFLAAPSRGCIGYHPSALPRNRGRAVIPWTILQGESQTGSTLFWLDEGLDSGNIMLQERFPVALDETAQSLYAKHLRMLRNMLHRAVPLLASGSAPSTPQDHTRATYCAKRTPADGMVDWHAPAERVWRLIRAVGDPYPGAFTFQGSQRLHLWSAEPAGRGPYVGVPGQIQALEAEGALVTCGEGRLLRLQTVQLEGEDRAPAARVLKRHEKLGIDWLALWERSAAPVAEAWA
jgi:methionyl-tRNA formyltransferase